MAPLDHHPSRRQLAAFAWLMPLFVALVAALAWSGGARDVATWIALGGGALSIALLVVHPLRRPVHRAWMVAAYPVGWLVTHVVLLAIWLLVATPTALVLRALGRDPMQRRIDRDAATYWVRRTPTRDRSRYFRQY